MIKLYVFFNLLDVCDKLCSSIGPDLHDTLFARFLGQPPTNVPELPTSVLFVLFTIYLGTFYPALHVQTDKKKPLCFYN